MPKHVKHVPRAVVAALALSSALTGLSGCSSLSLVPAQKTLPAGRLKSELLTAPIGSKPFGRGTLAPGGILTRDQFVDGLFDTSQRVSEKGDVDQDGFKYAVQANWDASDGTQADVFLVQFATADGAQDYVSGVSEGTSEQESPSEPLSAIPGIPGGESWTAGAIDSAGDIRQTAWYSVGNIAVDLHFYAPGTADTAQLTQLAKDQYARLTGNVTTPSPLPSSSATARPTARQATATAADRRRLQGDLVSRPSGAQPWASTGKNGPTGVLTLQQFATRFADPAHRSQVIDEETDRGFQYAVRENWIASDGVQADVVLLQFSSATGAQSFTLGYQGGAGDEVGRTGTYAVPGAGDTMAYEHPGLDSDGNIWTEGYGVVGDIAVTIDVYAPGKADRAAVQDALKRQYAALMADPTVSSAAGEAPPLPTPGP
ncbi:hypothetical protein GXW83_12750 [Streptacidiphilus sp. PB12-B1b]|uniref:hypothetical protein n=1 Tax=Streptacidiphilus sp. PB12-B1b TaxID=2705012 RepID=UPI0015F82131|nr:hypothetical protein [Streptacidiphilus sp. PB12-B1b]QMU76480.1 hypothetical protein GXW83_12750 [Streptacidiphilus sp. PB12-B1b]